MTYNSHFFEIDVGHLLLIAYILFCLRSSDDTLDRNIRLNSQELINDKGEFHDKKERKAKRGS